MPEKTFRLYNTLTRSLDAVAPMEPGHLRFYSCGPTVYSYAHIGNFRTFLTADLVVRVAEALGWDVTYVTNITDVGHLTEDDRADAGGEDKMAKALRSKEGEHFVNVWDLARYYTEAYQESWDALNMRAPTVRPRATEHMREQIQAIEKLIADGHAYETENGVYFDVNSFPDYGKLSGNRAADQLEQAVRDVVVDDTKRDPRDFALWKKDDKHLMQWHSPWGWGFPGWHLECSVMSMAYLGAEYDLHGGGEDLIFPHHECEIAQSESLTGKSFARLWFHTRFLQVEGERMAKRKGNFFTVRDLIAPEAEGGRGLDPLALRLTLISGHYRKPYNFTFQTLKANAKHLQRFREVQALVADALAADQPGEDHVGKRLDAIYERTLDAMLDDLNTPAAFAAVLEGIRLLNGFGNNLNGAAARSAQAWMDRTNGLLGVFAYENETTVEAASDEDPEAARIDALVAERDAARAARDFARADALRDQLLAEGIEIMDTPDGTKWRKAV